ncbi:hypothetical protein ACMFMG_003340 [Clarireedia jacksonii]
MNDQPASVNSGASPSKSTGNPRRAPKSRQGCQRCKAKRLKCDEKKPHCFQCVKRQAECSYIGKQLVWSTKHEKLLGENPALFASASELSPGGATSTGLQQGLHRDNSTPLSVEPQSEQSHRSSSFGREDTSPIVAGNSTDHGKETVMFNDSLSAIRHYLTNSKVPEFLVHLPTMLVEYYFSYICSIFSSFDGMLNPFRVTVGRLWDGSAPIYYAIQSMAAAYLSNHFPRMSVVGAQMQRESLKSLYQLQRAGMESQENVDKTLLTVLLVGQTTAWHNPKDLGLVHLETAKRLNRRRLEYQKGAAISSKTQRQNRFFEQCIVYWDMLAAFVEDDEYLEVSEEASRENISTPSSEDHQIFPHPWAGVAPKLQVLFSNIGRLIRANRKTPFRQFADFDLNDPFFPLNSDDPNAQGSFVSESRWVTSALDLEEQLLSFNLPSEADLVDAGDANTPVRQYILLAEAYRCAGLLEIYRVFPSVYLLRQSTTQEIMSVSAIRPVEEFLISLALHITSLLEKLPKTSGTRCLQPIVLIVAASELRFSPPTSSTFPLSEPYMVFPGGAMHGLESNTASLFNAISNFEVDVAAARRFVMTRFQDFQLSLPGKPIGKAIILVQEAWARADLGQDVFWMDVMSEMGLETIYG